MGYSQHDNKGSAKPTIALNLSPGGETMRNFSVALTILLAVLAITSVGFGQVVMNEIYSRGVVGNLDWIEVYNGGNTSVDISGYKIYDIGGYGGTKTKKPFPAGTVLVAHGVYVIVTDTNSTGLTDGFGLSSSGEAVWLENATGTVIDTVLIPALGVDTSFARQTDGSASWVKKAPTTRNTTNSQIVMNEIYSRGVAGNLDWIEVYNAADGAIDISGYKIYDVGGYGGTKTKKPFPAGTTLLSHAVYVIVTDTNSTGLTDGFGLSSTGEAVWLENATGLVLDTVYIPALGVDTSFARKPDGSPNWVKLSPVTRGATNGIATAVREEQPLVSSFALNQNYPNPFNPTTVVSYQLPVASNVRLVVYDMLGREVATLVNELQQPGQQSVQFNAAHLSSGVYLYRLTAGTFTGTRKLLLVR
jgi:hypothetical protein